MDGTRSSGAEDILEAALAQAFSPPPSRRQSADLHAGLENTADIESGTSSTTIQDHTKSISADILQDDPSASSPSDDAWKAEYEEQVETWRAQSSQAREKAEKERKRWEELRGLEQEGQNVEVPVVVKEGHEAGWETLSNSRKIESTVVSGLYATDSVTRGAERQVTLPATSPGPPTALPRTHSHLDAESQKWEDIHSSVTSSFPSLSYPERSETPSPSQNRPVPSQTALPPTATLAMFDSTLSTRTRIKALFSSVAINMLLPFINGVMLGFGEIFAKNVILGWLGWKIPGSVAATTGIGVSTPWGQRPKSK